MITDLKLIKLERNLVIICATLDYLAGRIEGDLDPDQIKSIKDYYIQQKIQAEKLFQKRRLDKLVEQLANLKRLVYVFTDLKYDMYIKDKTGYDMDLYEELRKKVDAILHKREVYKTRDHDDINTLIRYYRYISTLEDKDENLRKLLLDYSKMDTSRTHNSKNHIVLKLKSIIS